MVLWFGPALGQPNRSGWNTYGLHLWEELEGLQHRLRKLWVATQGIMADRDKIEFMLLTRIVRYQWIKWNDSIHECIAKSVHLTRMFTVMTWLEFQHKYFIR